MEGNWKWGKFYYNVSYAVSTISGCSMDGNGNLVAFAIGDSKPILLEIDTKDGTVSKFISFDRKSGGDKSMPLFHSFNAIYHDTNDVDDGLAYYYISFFQDDSLQIVRVKRETKEIVWNYQYKYVTTDDKLKYLMTFTPAMLHQDPADRSRMYLLGRFADRASVIKFSKNSMNIDWKLQIGSAELKAAGLAQEYPLSDMNEIYSFVQPPRSNKIFACGFKYIDQLTNPDARLASVFKMDDQGDVSYVYVFGNRAKTSKGKDICRAIDYDPDNREIVMMLEVTTPELRPDYYLYSRYSAKNKDILIVTMNDDGRLQEAYNINMGKAGISLYVGGHSLVIRDGHYIFGGYSWGYKTRYQNSTFDVAAPDYDTYVFKYNP